MTEIQCILQNLQNLANAVVTMFGRNCEACVHDLTSLHSSLVYIAGGVTGRQPGAPATDLLVKLINGDNGGGEVHSYRTHSGDGRELKSTTTLFRNREGKPVAAFCINFDTTEFYNASQALLPFLGMPGNGGQSSTETFAHSPGETMEALFQHAVNGIGKHPTTMNSEEKKRLIAALEGDGLFQFKGAVEYVARLMGITRFTVYNYLKRIRVTTTIHQPEAHQ